MHCNCVHDGNIGVAAGFPFGDYRLAFDTGLPRVGSTAIIVGPLRLGAACLSWIIAPILRCSRCRFSKTLTIDLISVGVFVLGCAADPIGRRFHSRSQRCGQTIFAAVVVYDMVVHNVERNAGKTTKTIPSAECLQSGHHRARGGTCRSSRKAWARCVPHDLAILLAT